MGDKNDNTFEMIKYFIQGLYIVLYIFDRVSYSYQALAKPYFFENPYN